MFQFSRHVLQAMHSQIDAMVVQRFFNFLGKHPLGADLGQRDAGDFVAGGLVDLVLTRVAFFRPAARPVFGPPTPPVATRGSRCVILPSIFTLWAFRYSD